MYVCVDVGPKLCFDMSKRGVCSCEGGPAEACQECLEGIIANSEQLANSTDAAVLLLQKRDIKRTAREVMAWCGL